MRTFVLPYNQASESAKKLAQAMGAKRIKRENSRYKYKPGDRIINWGCSEITNPEVLKAPVINTPYHVGLCANKREFFINYPANRGYLISSTTSRDQAMIWSELGFDVVCRHLLNGHSGEGIEIVDPTMLMPYAPLYTLYQKKTDEYRIHFVGNRLIKFARKGRKLEVPAEDVNWKVRNLAGGFVYALSNYEEMPRIVLDACEDFADNSGLTFGAIDVIYHKPTGCGYILEVNTAPGLSGTTIEAYAEALKNG
jgi:glutathione synthase/RimK-type ligase-like ATP-grasp enzyme